MHKLGASDVRISRERNRKWLNIPSNCLLKPVYKAINLAWRTSFGGSKSKDPWSGCTWSGRYTQSRTSSSYTRKPFFTGGYYHMPRYTRFLAHMESETFAYDKTLHYWSWLKAEWIYDVELDEPIRVIRKLGPYKVPSEFWRWWHYVHRNKAIDLDFVFNFMFVIVGNQDGSLVESEFRHCNNHTLKSEFSKMTLDVHLFIKDKGGDPDAIRESQKKRYHSVEVVDEVIAMYDAWVKRKQYT